LKPFGLCIALLLSICSCGSKVNAQVALDTFTVNLGRDFIPSQLNEKLIYPLIWDGYLTAFANKIGPGTWQVTKGRKFSFLIDLDSKSDSLIDLSSFKRWSKEWLKEQNELGYPFATIKPRFIAQYSDTLAMELIKDYGEQWYYDSIIFDNFTLSTRLLNWTARIKPGNPFSAEKNELLFQRLAAIDGFDAVNPGISYAKQNNKQISRFAIRKSRKDILSGIIGLNADGSGNRTITGELNGEFYNIMNSGTGMQFSWQSFRARSQEFDINVQTPYLFGLPFITTGDFNFQKFDSLYTISRRGLGLQFPLSRRIILGANYEVTDRNRIFADENLVRATQQLPNNPNSKNTLYGLQLTYRKGDLSYFSRNKLLIKAKANVGNRVFIKDARIANITWISSDGKVENVYDSLERVVGLKSNQLSLNVDADWHVPISKLFVIRSFSKVNILQLPQVFFNELSRYGGIKTLLGFNEQSIFANQFYSAGLELRLVTGNSGFIGIQANAARYINESGQGGIGAENIYGAGLTTAISTRAGILQIAWAMGNGATSRFGFNQSKFHFGLVTNLDN